MLTCGLRFGFPLAFSCWLFRAVLPLFCSCTWCNCPPHVLTFAFDILHHQPSLGPLRRRRSLLSARKDLVHVNSSSLSSRKAFISVFIRAPPLMCTFIYFLIRLFLSVCIHTLMHALISPDFCIFRFSSFLVFCRCMLIRWAGPTSIYSRIGGL